jgi:iron(III) transport system substrate-binding protein
VSGIFVAMKRPLVALLALVLVAAVALVASHVAGPGGPGRRVVVVYSAHAQEDLDALVPRCEAETGITLEVVKLGSGEVAQRVRAEKERPRCDVIWSIAGDQLEGCADLLDPIPAREPDAIEPAFRTSGRWLPYSGLMLAIVVNTKLVAADRMPRTWADLADPRWKGQLSMARADASGSAYMQLVTVLATQGPRGWDVYRGILGNAVLSASSSAVPRLVNDGEAAVGLTLEDNALRFVQAGGPVKLVYPEDGTVVAPDGVALVHGAPHPDDARAFIDWTLSKSTQEFVVQRTGRRPVRRDGATAPGLPPLGSLKTVPYPFEEAAARKQDNLARWQALVVELGK